MAPLDGSEFFNFVISLRIYRTGKGLILECVSINLGLFCLRFRLISLKNRGRLRRPYFPKDFLISLRIQSTPPPPRGGADPLNVFSYGIKSYVTYLLMVKLIGKHSEGRIPLSVFYIKR